MRSSKLSILFLLLAVNGSFQKSSPSDPTYRVAILEFKPLVYKNDSARTLNGNADKVVSYIKKASGRKADIVVFPELVPTTIEFPLRQALLPWATEVPAPSQYYSPCISSDKSVSEAIRKISCAAHRQKIYVAVNVIERENYLGRDCPHDEFSFYVTSVVFDRRGVIVSRYRKSNLFDEQGIIDVVTPPEKVTFTTDFGVTFGHIICSDIFYREPWLEVAKESGVTDFIFQAAWFTKLPFLSSIEIQTGWSYAEDINLLAAGYNNALKGYTGSGIYAGRQGIVMAVTAVSEYEEMIVANVPKKLSKSQNQTTIPRSSLYLDNEGRIKLHDVNQSGYQIRNESLRRNDTGLKMRIIYDDLKAYETKLISDNGTVVHELSHNGIKCKFQVNVTDLIPPSTYRLIAYDGPYPIGFKNILGFIFCSVVECTDVTLNSCGRIHNSSTVFQSIEVIGIHLADNVTKITPNSLGTNLFPVRGWFFDQENHDERVFSLMYLPKPTRQVISFGIWGRNYSNDVRNSAHFISNELINLTILFIIVKKVCHLF